MSDPLEGYKTPEHLQALEHYLTKRGFPWPEYFEINVSNGRIMARRAHVKFAASDSRLKLPPLPVSVLGQARKRLKAERAVDGIRVAMTRAVRRGRVDRKPKRNA